VRRRFKIGFVILLVATILWEIAWCEHIIAYDKMVRKSEERYWKQREESPWVWSEGLYPPINAWGYGLYLTVSGFFIFVTWELVLEWAYKDWRKEKSVKNEKVGWVPKVLKTLASILIILLYPIALFGSALILLVLLK